MPTHVERLSPEAFRSHPRRASAARAWVAAVLVPFCLASTAHGQTTTYQIVKAFDGPSIHGSVPYAPLVQATDGSLYGTTYQGGAFGLGTVFKIDGTGTLTTLHSFAGDDGANPFAGVIQGTDGNFYGTTFYGGSSGVGVIFKMDTAGTLTTIHSFAGGSAGAYPHSGVIQAADGSFYGTTYNSNGGGPGDRGTIFRLDGTGTFTTLHVFTGGSDGANPIARLMQAADGSFYGTTYGAAGTVFKIDASGTLTTVHQFTGGSDGSAPYAPLIQGTDGSVYGTTLHGGTSGGGTVFKLDASGALTTLHGFASANDVNGAVLYPGVIQAADGSLYGLTSYGDGTIFRLTLSGTLTTLHNFRSGGDGNNAFPVGELIQGADGRFYGTTSHGGAGDGTVFSLDATGTFVTLYRFSEFDGGADGSSPQAPVIQASDGNLYGTTSKGGAQDVGTVFTIDGAGTLTTLHSFAGWEGAYPTAGVIEGSNGLLYGTTSTGGSCCAGPPAAGTVFALDAAATLTTLHTFIGNDEGTFPGGARPSGVIEAADGRLYGTTYYGGEFDAGTVFTIDAGGTHTLLHSFSGGVDGGYPYAGLIQGSDGRLYGTTVGGGDGEAGTVFAIDAAGTLTTLHSFAGGSEGAFPYARVLQIADGSLYGTTGMGGADDAGTVFRVDAAGVFTTLYAFTRGSDGATPYAGVIQGADAALYGTTSAGGGGGVGTVFKLDATGTLTTLHTFSGGDGRTPLAELLHAVDGSFYGTTSAGGPNGGGTVFRLTFGTGEPLTPVITFGPAPAVTYLQGNFAVPASTTNTDNSGLTYSAVSGPCVVVDASAGIFGAMGAGLCTVRASGAETPNFAAVSAQHAVTIAKAAATVTLTNLNQTYTGSALSPTATTTPSGLAFVWTNVPQINVGSYVAGATIDDVNYDGAASGTFVINPPPSVLSVTVMSPNGGEHFVKGVALPIRWSATGHGVPNPASFNVALSRNGGAYSNIAGCTNLDGALRSCTWTPSNAASDLRVRVTARDAAGNIVSDTSNGSFVVTAH